MNRPAACLGALASLVLSAWISAPAQGHEQSGSALQLLGFEADPAPAPIDGDISPDGGESKWSSAYLRSVTFASTDGSVTRPGTVFLTSDGTFLYVGVGFNSGSASGQNYTTVYFDQNHDHALAGTATLPGEYYVKLTGADPGAAENGGWYDTNGWQSYGAAFPPGFEAVSQKHGSGNPQTFNFEFKIPLSSLPGPSGESFLDVPDSTEIGLLVEVFDTSDGVMYWEPTGRDPLDASTWGEAEIGLRGPERQMASSIALGHTPVIDGNVVTDSEWQHYTSVARSVLLTNYAGDFLQGTLRSKSTANDVYLALEIDGRAATVGDRLNVYLDYDAASGGDADYVLEHLTEDGVGLVYTGGGLGTYEDLHFENTPAWAIDTSGDGEGAVSHNGSGYEYELRIPLGGTGTEDLQVALGALVGMNLEFVDAGTGLSYWWDVSTNSRYQRVRVDATNLTALGWSGLQTGAPVVQPVFPRGGDEVSGHYPFTIYATAASGELGVVSAEFSDDLGLTWNPLIRVDESGLWTRTWNTTELPDGPHEIRLRATDENGLQASLVLGVVVDNASGGAGDRPTVTVSAPVAGAWVSGSTDIQFGISPASGQTILATEVSVDGGPWTPGTSPFPWDTTLGEDGSHIFQVRAIQSDSLVGTSDPRLVLADNSAPEVEALSIRYPAGQGAAKTGDAVVVTALARDAGAGLDPTGIDLDATALDGASHLLVDDGTNGDEVAGDALYSRAITVTSAVTGPVTVAVTARDVLGHVSPAVSAAVELDNTPPTHGTTASGDADTIYRNQDLVRIVTTWDGAGHVVTADFSAVDSNYLVGAEQVTDNGDGSYTISYEISFGNAFADAVGLAVPITASDASGNGPISHSGFTVELDNTSPAFASVDADVDHYRNGDTITLTAGLDDANYVVAADFSVVDSEYAPGAETVSNAGGVYTVTYTISPLNTIPDGSYGLAVVATDVAGNESASSTSVGLDNSPPEIEALSVAYPDGQTAAKAGDVVLVTSLVRDDGSGLDPMTVVLDSGTLDGASHGLVDDGTNGDLVAGDGLHSFAVTVTSTATGSFTVNLDAQDVLGNASPTVIAPVELDNADPALVSTSSGDADTIYKNTDVIRFVTGWDGAGYSVTADFSAIDGNYLVGAEQVTDNGDGTYTILYEISFENAAADGVALPVSITVWDGAGNGPVVDSGFVVELDNTPPGFASLDADRDNYADGDTVVLTAAMDDSTYALRCDFGAVDSGYSTGDETVARTGSVYTVTYEISPDAQNTTPDGSYTLIVEAEDIAGNASAASTSVELDNTPEAPVVLEPRDGQLLTADVVIDVTSPDDTRFVRFQVSPDDGANWYNLDGTQSPTDYTEDSDATDGWSRVWSTGTDALPDGVSYRIRVTAWDEQDPTAHLIGQDEVGGGLVVDNTPPSLEIAIAPVPSDGALTGEVFQPEITLTGAFFDLPDSARVVGITIEHRNENGDDVSDSPIHIPASGNTFSRVLRLLEGRNDLVVIAEDEAGLTFSRSAEIHYLVPEEATPIGPEGGTVEAPDGTSVVIPAGALLRTENISIVRIPADELPPTVDRDLALIKRAHDFGPDGIIFHRPVEITLTYTDADLDRNQDGAPDWDEASLNAYFWEGASWVKTNTPSRRTDANSLSFQVNHFSTFDIGVISRGAGETQLYWTRNPFRPDDGTTCVFELPEAGLASLEIYDLAGQRVATIADKKRVSSSSSLRWDGRNDFDRFVGSGVYVYVFEFEGDEGASLMFRKPLGVVK